MQFRAVKGMNDLLPEELRLWHRLEAAFVQQAKLHGFAEMRPPILEPTQLFVRSIGEVTDVVQKEMYTLTRGDENLALRPEGTAGCARAYVQHSVLSREPVTRWYYLGPMFRAERPQRGRYRQFYQAGCEIYGDAGPVADAELIAMLVRLFRELGIESLKVKVNSIGNGESRSRFREALVEYLTPIAGQLSELSQQRLERNPLRILDSKSDADQRLLEGAPSTVSSLTGEDRAHFDKLCAMLGAFGVPFEVDPKLVRGLDYYTRTVFEVQSDAGNLGAQNTLAAGGRYDNMIAELGGKSVPAIGFAMGLERVLLSMGDRVVEAEPLCALLPLGDKGTVLAASLAGQLRDRGVRVELDGRDNSLKSKLRRADGLGAGVALVIGDSEAEKGVVQIKNLRASTQRECPLDQATAETVLELTMSGKDGQNPSPPAAESQG